MSKDELMEKMFDIKVDLRGIWDNVFHGSIDNMSDQELNELQQAIYECITILAMYEDKE